MADLPIGTVTFLFTDIEGSTRRWEQHPGTMPDALARHDAIVRHSIEAHHGVVFRTVGDAFCAAFARAPDALLAALAAQRALQAALWEAAGPLRVRMALHTGAVDVRDGEYVGHVLNRMARLLAVGHGGQVLLSGASQELVRDNLPPAAVLRELGTHQLKDLSVSEHIYQLVTLDLPSDFPALKTLNAETTNLPAQPTALIGREQEVAAVCTLLRRPEVRLLTLTGPGGIGKTRLGLQVAAELLDAFKDGVYFVALASLRDATLVPATIAQTLGLREAGSLPLHTFLNDYLRDKQLLLLLDNLEQIPEAAAAVADLLALAPHLKVLITSRVALHLYGEHEYVVPSLALPDLKHLAPLERLREYEAVRLFIERSQAAKADFAVTNANAPAIAEICCRLDGLPLALELAAARSKYLAPQALLDRLEHRLQVLTGGPVNLPSRQQTLRNTIAWSYHLLEPAEQTLFWRLSVFVGGFAFEAAEAVCNASRDLPLDVLDGLASLLDKSLLRQAEGLGGDVRFTMLETIREYALERLAESGERDTIRRQHLEHYLALAEQAGPELDGAQAQAWLDRLRQDYDNLRAALGWVIEQDAAELGLRLTRALQGFWLLGGYIGEHGDYAAARGILEQCETIYRRLGDKRSLPAILATLGRVLLFQGEQASAGAILEECTALCQEVGDHSWLAASLLTRATVAIDQADYRAAHAFTEQSLSIYQTIGDPWGIAQTVNYLGDIARCQGDYERAAAHYQESLRRFQAQEIQFEIAAVLHNLGYAVMAMGDQQHARACFVESLALHREQGNRPGMLECLAGLGALLAAQRQPRRAAILFGAIATLRVALNAPMWPAERVEYERHLASVGAALSEGAFQAALQDGRTMTLEQAIVEALKLVDETM
jgi:predicted ATPase/class 3 adenylate cyclase